MRLLALVAVLVVVLLVVALWMAARDRRARAEAAAEASAVWVDAHETVGGVTRVVVRRTARLPLG